MKNKTLITMGLIIFLSAAVILKNRSCGTDVPELEAWYEPADEINIRSVDHSLVLARKGDNWLVNEQAYPGDPGLIGSLEKKARDFKLLDLVSDKGYYDKYDLTDEKGVLVTIKGKGKVLRKILIGKAGSTNNHSYVKVNDRKEIFFASGIMKTDFTLNPDDIRNKEILTVSKNDVKSLSINYGGKKYEFYPVEGSGKTAVKEGEKPAVEWKCRGYEKLKLRENAINELLNLFSPLRASTYPENTDRKNAGRVLCTVDIEAGNRKVNLVIFDKKDKDMNMKYAASSESPYIFTMGSWQTEKLFIKNINNLTVK